MQQHSPKPLKGLQQSYGFNMILINNRQRKIIVNVNQLTTILERMVVATGYKNFDVGVLLTTNKSIQNFNRDFRHQDKPTDILSFPYHAELQAGEKIIVEHEEDKNLGDIVISLEYVEKKAAELERTFEEHLIILLAHGIAHLLNYDHVTDEDYAVMQKVEDKLLKAAKK